MTRHPFVLPILRGALIVGLWVACLPFVAFFGMFLIPVDVLHGLEMFVYDTVFSVIPLVCESHLDVRECLSTAQSHPVVILTMWTLTALAFGWATRAYSSRRQLIAAPLLVLATATIVRLTLPLFGLRVVIDTI